jgi:hypothetical protein
MPRHATVDELSQILVSFAALRALGVSERIIAGRVRSGELTVVRRGWYVESAVWKNLWPESRHLLHVLAVVRDGRGSGVVSHESAAVVHGLPLYRRNPARVHLTTDAPRRIASGPDVFRHVCPLPPEDVTVVRGVTCTSLARTVFDTSRSLPLEAAVSIADAAERSVAERQREWNEDALARWRRLMTERIAGAGGARGIRSARFVSGFAQARAQLPLESVSRLQLHRLGFRILRVQVPVAAPNGRWYYLDLGLDEIDAFGECDGETKYRDEALRSGRSLEDVLLEEKYREDWIRGTTNRRMLRWGDAQARTSARLGHHLLSLGATLPS